MSNKTSDKNVDRIEKDIERCKQLTKPEHANWIGISNQLAITDILAELERRNKRIKELEEERDHWHGCFIVAMENSIPKQVVIEALENIEDYFDLNGPGEEIEYIKQVKKELLEGEK